jgi:DNA-binding beta-propeller fold protein YncE
MKKTFATSLIFLLTFPAIVPGLGDKKYDPTSLVFPSFLHTLGIRKATKTHFMIYTKNKVKVRNPQGLAIVRLESWENPDKKKDDDEVTGYGINSGENVIVYNRSMTSLGLYGVNETGEKALKNPMDVAANQKGDVYVADTGNHRIVRLFNPKQNLKFVRAIGGRGALPGQFEAPQGVALDSHGMVYVSDTGNHRIQILRPDDMLHRWFGDQGVEDGELWHPTGIAVTDSGERWSYYKDSFIALIDLDHTRVQKFTLDGKFLKAIRLKDFGYSSGYLAYLAIDYYSNIWVTDTANHRIHKFDRNLNYLTSFGRKGKGDKEFMEPRGIAIYKRFGQVFVAEKESAQYYWIGTDIFNFKGEWDAEKGIIGLDFFLTEPSYLTLQVENSKGTVKAVVFKRAQYFSGPQKIYLDGSWQSIPRARIENPDIFGNGAFAKLKSLPKGKYTFKLKVEPTYSSYKYFSKEVETRLSVSY